MPPEPTNDRYQPLALIGVTLAALLGFAVFFLSFLVAPLAILLIFYIGFAVADRTKRPGAAPPPDGAAGATADGRPRLAREAEQRRHTLEPTDAPPSPPSRPDRR